MSKKKFEPLKVGDRIWLECISAFTQRESYIQEYEIVKVNKTSAYAAHVENLHKSDPLTRRIEQRSRVVHNGYSAGYAYRFWSSKEAWEAHRAHMSRVKELRAQGVKKVKSMTLSELETFLGVEGDKS